MLEVFSLTGDPGSIRSSSVKWSTFSTSASTASGDIRHIDSGDFIGDEAETYRDKINKDLPPHLDTTSEAWAKVAGALQTYATALEGLQQRMSTLSAQADHQQGQVNAANDAVANAKTADSQHASSVAAAKEKLKPGQTLPPDHYQTQTSGATSSQTDANAALQSTIDAANRVHTEHNTAVDNCVNAIHDAAGMRFEEPPGFWGKLGNAIGGWIKDHADVLKTISSVLKTISGIAGLLAMIPVLAPIMGPIALATGGAALLIDVGVKVATGEGSWTDIGMDALGIIPGGRVVGEVAKGAKATTTVIKDAKGIETVAKDAKGIKTVAQETKGAKNVVSDGKTAGRDVTENAGKDARTAENAVDDVPQLPTIKLKYKKSWTQAQRDAADMKVKQLNDLAAQGKLQKTTGYTRSSNLRARFKALKGDGAITSKQDVDHIHELQLGGKDVDSNLQALDRSVNRSVGAQIKHQIKGHRTGTGYGGVSIVPRK